MLPLTDRRNDLVRPEFVAYRMASAPAANDEVI